MSAPFSELIAGIKSAIVDASASLHGQNMALFNRYFERVDGGVPESEGPDVAVKGREFEPPRPGSTFAHLEGEWKPRTIAVQLPVEDADGLRVKLVHVPLIGLVAHRNVSIDEIRVVTEIEFHLGDETEDPSRTAHGVRPRKVLTDFQQSPGSGGATRRRALVEIKLKGDDMPEAYARVLGAYSNAVRNQIP